ncbi:MAG: TIGR02281 family clan AA aspartic protease, partial [Gammaproteobacteria bacterium]|nr:TIGR02281 family clan AA aspartic protease [Gammaproteobacteria bacterium]
YVRKILFISVIFVAGGTAGWLLNHKSHNDALVVSKPITISSTSPATTELDKGESEPLDMAFLFVKLMAASGFKPGNEYEYVRNDFTPELRQALDLEFYKYVDLIFSKRQTDDKIIEKLSSLLTDTETDKKVLDKLAIVLKEKARYAEALNTLIRLNHWSQFPADYEAVNQRIDKVIDLNIEYLQDKKRIQQLGDFYRFVMDHFPQNYQIKWRYANFLHDAKRYDDAKFILDELQYVPGYEEKVAQLNETVRFHIANAMEDITPIELEKFGENYFISAIINHEEPVKLLIDTGASMTVISPELAYSLGLMDSEPDRFLDFQTANGKIRAAVVTLENLSVGNYSVGNLAVGVLPFPGNTRIQGLLGMNFLKNYKFYIDQQKQTLELITQ